MPWIRLNSGGENNTPQKYIFKDGKLVYGSINNNNWQYIENVEYQSKSCYHIKMDTYAQDWMYLDIVIDNVEDYSTLVLDIPAIGAISYGEMRLYVGTSYRGSNLYSKWENYSKGIWSYAGYEIPKGTNKTIYISFQGRTGSYDANWSEAYINNIYLKK